MDHTNEDHAVTPYQPLHTRKFRLLRILPKSAGREIHGVLSHHQFPRDDGTESVVKYTALSYCWGDPKPAGSITLNGHPLAVTANLLQALETILKHHMSDRRMLFWIDAVCIDQTNLEEKAEQVQQMWQIFKNASIVFAWLGDEARDVHVLHESRAQFGDLKDPSQQRSFSDVNVGLTNLSHRMYFTRTWTRPEFLRAKVLYLISGKYSFDWNWVMRRIEAWPKRRKHEALPANAYQLFLSRGNVIQKNTQLYHVQFADMLRLYSRTGCYDPRDRIYSMLSDPGWPKLRHADWWIEPDYRLSNEELALLVLGYYDYLVKWDSRRRKISLQSQLRGVCDSVMVALQTSRSEVRSLALDLAKAQSAIRPERLELGYGFDVELIGPILSKLWSGTGVWEERPG